MKNMVEDFNVLEEQENLTKEILSQLIIKRSILTTARPQQNFSELMQWGEDNFKTILIDQHNLNKFIHNRIIIDGEFLQFSKENKVKIECLYKDSIVSWQQNNSEKFFAQGVFLIEGKNFEFLQFTLMHKGNQNEDEISFFNIVSESNYQNYIKFRNEFDSWITQRDRSNLHIKVIEGEDILYTRSNTWQDLFLPEVQKTEIKSLVENFLSSKDFYFNNNLPWKRGILMHGEPGCGKTSVIKTIISQYNFKPVTIAAGSDNTAISEAFAYAESQNPSLLYFEDLDSMLDKNIDTSNFLNLMDGISSKNGLLVVATANDLKKLKSSVTDRPSRFDRKFHIPLPDQQMAYLYLKKWFGNMLNVAKYKDLAKHACQCKFSYAYLKELYISSMFEALSNNRKVPTEGDISKALGRLMKDKNILNPGKSVKTDKYFSK